MKVSLSWLKEYINLEMDVAELSEMLTMAGLEVDAVSDRFDYLNGVFVCKIIEVSQHPNADRLKLCRVDIGDRRIDVVCGAPNASANMLTACALPGACLPGGHTISKGVIRGVASEGMLCSESELGLTDKSSGIMEIDPSVLTPGSDLGTTLGKALNLSDHMLEIDLTPNRPDCLSIIGVAREIAASRAESGRLCYPEINLPEPSTSRGPIHQHTSVTIEAPELCPRYTARLVCDVTVGPSPFWLRDRLLSVGLNPVNNIVDITNFVMMETGQPLHAFDFDRLAEHRIVVRTGRQGESFTTLDNKKHSLSSDTLMICDGQKPVAIGGVMGGLNSEIESTTTNVLIESACFEPTSIRKTAKKTGLNTDAAHRFERGVDPLGTLTALNRAAALITEMGNGTLIEGIIDENPIPYQDQSITLDKAAANRRLGTRFSRSQMADLLNALEFKTVETDNECLQVTPPSFRVDVSRPEDLTEELARIWGYNKIETTFPEISLDTQPPSKILKAKQAIRNLMAGIGFCEAINYSFISKLSFDRLELSEDDSRRQTVDLLNPISEEQAVMRTSLVPGLLETMKKNLSVQNKTLKIFEIGKIFLPVGADEQPNEIEMLGGLWTGDRCSSSWLSEKTNCDFYDLKGAVEELLKNLKLTNLRFTRLDPQPFPYMKPGYMAAICLGDTTADNRIGTIGEVHPHVLRNYDLKQPAFIFEIDVQRVFQAMPERTCAYSIPKFPATTRDITMILDNGIETFTLLQAVQEMSEQLVEDVRLFDVYDGDPIPEGKKSVSFRITYQSETETLQDDVVNALHKKISDRLLLSFQATLPA